MSTVAETIARPPVIEMLNAAITSARAPDTAVISGINWIVSLDDYWVIGGPTSSGKSNLLVTAAGLQRPLCGVHRLFGRELPSLREPERLHERLRVGMVFEDGARPFPQLTVAENIALPLRYHRDWNDAMIRQRVEEMLDITGLSAFADSAPLDLMRALIPRVGLARALALGPEVLLLDNPLAGLDPRQERWWLDFIASLASGHPSMKGRKMTIVVTCDDLRPWTSQGRQFALLKGKHFLPLGGRDDLKRCNEPLLHDLTAAHSS
ncbi:MAG: ATP-binding cassette domain-containing protein [Verrucomicrobia bacterium]|nr:ATP-binding cassette domain-containing protein [Verrucomicrobiota bacterium]